MRLSIIVPVYNVELYIERCLRSLLENQDLPPEDYEVIVTNDGSPDNCRTIIEGLQKEFPNLILINQKNQGVSVARNEAIDIARGGYILAIDSDDYIHPNSLRKALERAEQDQLDILYAGFEVYDIHQKLVWTNYLESVASRIDGGYNGYMAFRKPGTVDPDRSVAMFFKLELLNQHQIRYPKGVIMLEDALFLALVFSVSHRVGYHAGPFYIRTTRPHSATTSGQWNLEKTATGYFISLRFIADFRSKCGFSNSGILNNVQVKFLVLLLNTFLHRAEIKGYSRTWDELEQDKLLLKNELSQSQENFQNAFSGIGAPYNIYVRSIMRGKWSYLISQWSLILKSVTRGFLNKVSTSNF